MGVAQVKRPHSKFPLGYRNDVDLLFPMGIAYKA